MDLKVEAASPDEEHQALIIKYLSLGGEEQTNLQSKKWYRQQISKFEMKAAKEARDRLMLNTHFIVLKADHSIYSKPSLFENWAEAKTYAEEMLRSDPMFTFLIYEAKGHVKALTPVANVVTYPTPMQKAFDKAMAAKRYDDVVTNDFTHPFPPGTYDAEGRN